MRASNFATIEDAERALDAGEATSVALTDAFLREIEATEPNVAALLTVTADGARSKAQAADERCRYGVIADASSLDQVGPMTRTARDAAALLDVIAGHDPRDSTSAPREVPDDTAGLAGDVAGVRGFDEQGLPIGLQISAPAFEEGTALRAADAYQPDTDFHQRRPQDPDEATS